MVKYANRGRTLETIIDSVNNAYKTKGLAVVDKIATPTTVKRMNGKIVGAKHTEKSTVDFVGLLNTGQFIAFDTKETKDTSLPFANIKRHQLYYLRAVKRNKGHAFFIVYFRKYQIAFRLDINDALQYMSTTDRKSFPFDFFVETATELKSTNGVAIDYLSGLQSRIYTKED